MRTAALRGLTLYVVRGDGPGYSPSVVLSVRSCPQWLTVRAGPISLDFSFQNNYNIFCFISARRISRYERWIEPPTRPVCVANPARQDSDLPRKGW